ncbi:ATP-dependent zinc metalloprotease FtsH [subsurface metagenome]
MRILEKSELEKSIQVFCKIIWPENIKENLRNIIGLESQKQLLKNIFIAGKKFRKLQKAGLNSNISALLYGPPGVGKTALTRAICRDQKSLIIDIQPSQIFESYFGETLKNITSLFKSIGEYSDIIYKKGYITVLFIDEFDSLARERADPTEIGEMKRAVNEFLRCIDTLMYENHYLIIIAATNHEFTLDSAVWRRFLYHIFFPLPTSEVRASLLRFFFNNLVDLEPNINLKLDFNLLSEKLEGYSPSDIERITRSIYVEFLSSNTNTEFLIDNEKIMNIAIYIGGIKDRLNLDYFKLKSKSNTKEKITTSNSISDLLRKEIEKTKKEGN